MKLVISSQERQKKPSLISNENEKKNSKIRVFRGEYVEGSSFFFLVIILLFLNSDPF